MKKKFIFNRFIWIGLVFLSALTILLPYKAQLNVNPPEIDDLNFMDDLRKEGNPKMESVLFRLMNVYLTEGIEEAKKFASERLIDMEGDSVRVVLEAFSPGVGKKIDIATSLISHQVEALNGKIETTYRQLVQSVVPLYALEDLADFSSIRYVRLPLKPIPLVTSEGVAKTGADQWHKINSYRSIENAKVCILDGGFKWYEYVLGSELPSSVKTRSFRADRDLYFTSHGTACAEIVHDMAPDAELLLVNFGTDVELHNAVDWIISQGVDIISYSMGWTNAGPGDGTGPICDDVKKAHDNGIIWVSSAGNSADKHWEGTFRDPDFDRWCNFEKPGEVVSERFAFWVGAGTSYSVSLNWDDWGTWTGASYTGSKRYDYDLYLYNSGGWLIRESENLQVAGAPPIERVGAIAASTGWRYISIYKYWSLRNCKLELFVDGGSYLEHLEPQGSLLTPADSPNAIAVGATDWYNDSFHSYSSQGPTSDERIKPDFAAPSGVSSWTYGYSRFSGTSASAPHVAGAFALLKGKMPYELDEIKKILEARAKDLGPSGKDNKYGYGRLKLIK